MLLLLQGYLMVWLMIHIDDCHYAFVQCINLYPTPVEDPLVLVLCVLLCGIKAPKIEVHIFLYTQCKAFVYSWFGVVDIVRGKEAFLALECYFVCQFFSTFNVVQGCVCFAPNLRETFLYSINGQNY
jgi:hypothetical protein